MNRGIERRRETVRVAYVTGDAADASLTKRHLEVQAPHVGLEIIDSGAQLLGRIPTTPGEPCPWEVVVLDSGLSGENALHLLERLRDEPRLEVPVVLLVDPAHESLLGQARGLGVTDCVVKHPNYLPALSAVIENAHQRELLARERAALGETVARLRVIIDTEPECVKVVGPDGRLQEMNRAGLRMMEADSLAELQRRPLIEAVVPEHRPSFLALHKQVMAGGTGILEFEVVGLKGRRRWLETHAAPLRNAEGEVVGLLGITRDVAERKLAEERLRDSEERFRQIAGRYRSLFESAPDGILVADSAGRYIDANPSFLEMIGYSREDLVGMQSSDVLAPKEHSRVDAALSEINQGFEHRNEWQFRRKDGSVFTADVKATVMADGRILAVVRDVTERKRLEVQLRQSQKMEAVGRLAGGIAHDFNNVLGVVLGYGETLRSTTPKDHPDRRRIDEIVRAAERGAGLTRQLLAFSRKQVLEPKVLEPSAVVTDMRRLLHPLIGEHIELVLEAKARGRVKVDPGQLEQVVMNLVVNARDAMPTGGTLRIETADVDLDQAYVQRRSVALRPGRYVTIVVADTGIGMDAATQAQVFEPFYTTKAEGRGTGLGLATAYGIVKQSGGYIWMYSEVGKGTVFRVYLPRVEDALANERVRPRIVRRPATETLLVVEDEPAARELVAEILRGEGYRVLVAGDGAEGVEIAMSAREPVHLLLTDVVLPKLGGRAAAERIRVIQPGIKVLYMSGYTDNEVSREGVLEPGIVLLQKPFTPDDLVRRVGEVLDGP